MSRHLEALAVGFRFNLPLPEVMESAVDKRVLCQMVARARVTSSETPLSGDDGRCSSHRRGPYLLYPQVAAIQWNVAMSAPLPRGAARELLSVVTRHRSKDEG